MSRTKKFKSDYCSKCGEPAIAKGLCRSCYNKKYYRENTGWMNYLSKLAKRRNKEKIKKYMAKYRMENKERFKEYRKRYYEKNKKKNK